ncbi:Chaperone protein DnaJ [Sesamum alatum]|uniref:Chaperone protein DnaJ n=1 Tax=Sesamum alatum TaxID=300844 RepID=A0AAE1YQ96_9LAMI|nr:Chaperone protein DnaJ [Sesamum alatum]
MNFRKFKAFESLFGDPYLILQSEEECKFLMECCNKEEAIRAKHAALEKMDIRDFTGARKYAVRAQELCPDLDNVVQIILVCDVHCSAAEVVCGDEMDWYKILDVDATSDEASIRRQYNRLALGLHPDKNRFPGAADAFRLIREAKAVLTDNEQRRLYDARCKAKMAQQEWGNYVFTRVRCDHLHEQQQAYPSSLRPNVGWSKLSELNGMRRFEGSMGSSKKTGGENVERRVKRSKDSIKRPKNDRSSNVVAQEVDIQGKKRRKTAEFASKNKNPANSASGIPPGLEILEYPASEFHDFDKNRAKTCFRPGQIWAAYDTLDAMPRFYALINNVTSQDFRLHITWLEPHPDDDEETRWLIQGLPASCGNFRLGDSETIDDHDIFSHIVSWKKRISLRNMYEVYPRKGETWALFKNWDISWFRDPESHKANEFEPVEILTDYCCGVGVYVGFLGKIEGFSSVFSQKTSEGMVCGAVLVKERLRFSHRVPSFQMTSNEGLHDGMIKSFFELDPASL